LFEETARAWRAGSASLVARAGTAAKRTNTEVIKAERIGSISQGLLNCESERVERAGGREKRVRVGSNRFKFELANPFSDAVK